jgi:hypothetical protein
MTFKTEKSIPVQTSAGKKEITRKATVTAPDALSLFPGLDAVAAKLVNRAIVQFARIAAGNALRNITAGMTDAEVAQFTAVKNALANADALTGLSDEHRAGFKAMILANPEYSKYAGLLAGEGVPLEIDVVVDAAKVLAWVEDDRLDAVTVDENEGEPAPSPAPVGKRKVK